MGTTSAKLDKHCRYRKLPNTRIPNQTESMHTSEQPCLYSASYVSSNRLDQGKPHPANNLGFAASCSAAIETGSYCSGNLHFLTDESDKSTSETKLLQTFNHSTSTTSAAGERHPTMEKCLFQICAVAFLLIGLAQGKTNG